MSGRDDDAEDEAPGMSRRRILFLIAILVVGLLGLLAFVQYSAYEHQVVNTVVETGSIASIKTNSVALTGLNNNNGAINGVPQNQVASISTSVVNVTLGSTSFTQSMPCSPTPYRNGQTVNVDVNTLRNGAHTYVGDLACKGEKSPFVKASSTISVTTTTTSSTSTISTSTTTSSSSKT
jgi:hypothetical protein